MVNALLERDLKYVWHPLYDKPIVMSKACGSYVYDIDGKRYLDLISNSFSSMYGHANVEIVAAIREQSKKLEHIIFAGFTHELAGELCEMLHGLLPEQLTRFFFSNSGSSAVEVAIKMAYKFWLNNGYENRKIFLCLEGAYHGTTVGAMRVGHSSGYFDGYKDLLQSLATVMTFPRTWYGDEEVEEKENIALGKLRDYLTENGEKVAAMIFEPLVQGAGGMNMCRPEFVRRAVQLLRSYGILVIFDEAITGFGKTGTIFAMDQIGVAPDILCLAKALSGGFIPISLTVATDDIYQTFTNSEHIGEFFHAHTYCGSALGCAAAIASLKILLRASTRQQIESISKVQRQNMLTLAGDCRLVRRARSTGILAAFDIDDEQVMAKFYSMCLENGLMVRIAKNRTVCLVPSFCTEEQELNDAYCKMKEILHSLQSVTE